MCITPKAFLLKTLFSMQGAQVPMNVKQSTFFSQ